MTELDIYHTLLFIKYKQLSNTNHTESNETVNERSIVPQKSLIVPIAEQPQFPAHSYKLL